MVALTVLRFFCAGSTSSKLMVQACVYISVIYYSRNVAKRRFFFSVYSPTGGRYLFFGEAHLLVVVPDPNQRWLIIKSKYRQVAYSALHPIRRIRVLTHRQQTKPLRQALLSDEKKRSPPQLCETWTLTSMPSLFGMKLGIHPIARTNRARRGRLRKNNS